MVKEIYCKYCREDMQVHYPKMGGIGVFIYIIVAIVGFLIFLQGVNEVNEYYVYLGVIFMIYPFFRRKVCIKCNSIVLGWFQYPLFKDPSLVKKVVELTPKEKEELGDEITLNRVLKMLNKDIPELKLEVEKIFKGRESKNRIYTKEDISRLRKFLEKYDAIESKKK